MKIFSCSPRCPIGAAALALSPALALSWAIDDNGRRWSGKVV